MGFLFLDDKLLKPLPTSLYGVSLEFLHRNQCSVCPLNLIGSNRHPHMAATGSEQPIIYMLGEAPGADEDKIGKQFVGVSGRVLHFRIPDEWLPDLRWNNVVRTRPPENRDPTPMEIECCRPSIIADIERSKPQAIFGFGNVPLEWATGRSGITNWSGRCIPVKIGSHACWFFPLVHPAAVLRSRHFDPVDVDRYGSDMEFAFATHLANAFATVSKGLREPVIHSRENAIANVEYVTGGNADDLKRVLGFLKQCRSEYAVGIDYETHRLRPYASDAKILSVALSNGQRTLAWPLYHRQAKWPAKEFKIMQHAFRDFLHTAPCRKVSFALPFEMEWSAYFYGIECLHSPWGDAQGQAYILDERQGALNLDFLCMQYFGFDLKAISNLDVENLDNEPLENVLLYNGMDAKYHRLLWHKQAKRLKHEGLQEQYQHQEERALAAVSTQLKGVPANQDIVKRLDKKYGSRLRAVEDKIKQLPIVKEFDKHNRRAYRPSAPADIKNALASIAIYPDDADEETLAGIDHPLAELTIQWRKCNKVLSTYVLPCKQDSEHSVIHPDGLMHRILSLCKTRTWRTSAEEPNDQNFPKRDEEHKEIREIVTPGGAFKVVSFDYAGIQARNIAMESRDAALVDAFWNRYDIHKDWMERILRSYPKWADGEKVANDKNYMKARRHQAKNGFVFPSFFGAQPPKIASLLNIPEHICHALQEELWDEFPDIHTWQRELTNSYYDCGYVTGLSGFRRRAPISINQLINSPIQSDEALIVCDAWIRLTKLRDEELVANMEIHDDLSFIWHVDEIERNAEAVLDVMLNVPFEWAHIVPIEVEMSVGDSWASTQEVGAYSSDKWNGTKFTYQPKNGGTDGTREAGKRSSGAGTGTSRQGGR